MSFNILDGEVYSHLEAASSAEQPVAEEMAADSQVSDADSAGQSEREPLLAEDPESGQGVVALSQPSIAINDGDAAGDTEPDLEPLALEEGGSDTLFADEEEAGSGMENPPQEDSTTTLELVLDTEALTGPPETILVDDPLKQEMEPPTAMA